MIDPVSLDTTLKILEIGSVVGATAVLLFKLGRITERFELVVNQQGKEISSLESSIKELSQIVVKQAVQSQRLDTQAERITLLERRVEELRHGQGLVT